MDKANIIKATCEQIKERVTKFVGSSGGGQWSFQLECRLCRDLGVISAKAHSIKSDKALNKAAKKFESQGWWFYENELICPKCYKRNILKIKDDTWRLTPEFFKKYGLRNSGGC